MQRELFSALATRPPAPTRVETGVPGLVLVHDYIDVDTERELMARADQGSWDSDWKRRVQQYGYGYGGDDDDDAELTEEEREEARAEEERDGRIALARRRARIPAWTRDIPEWLHPIARRLVDDGYIAAFPENVVINDYAPGVGIGAHRDYPAFASKIAALSVGSDIIIDFLENGSARKVSLHLPARSLWAVDGAARWRWKHAIAHRLSDVIDGKRVRRGRRLSITFRTATDKTTSASTLLSSSTPSTTR